MWICESCWDGNVYKCVSNNPHRLVCVGCKKRRRCFLVIRRSRA